ncbi:MAG: DUF1501 domain-containing protein [Armatimonadetes bacterium]|nr:DUF1501 domain-containing protein [Armatimonadota bacterium]MDE2206984.1 DUF1501 domain-containing protein [Armatimonadota bacterium]
MPRYGSDKVNENYDPLAITRRKFLTNSAFGIGSLGLMELLAGASASSAAPAPSKRVGGLPGFPNFAPKARRVIYLFQSGGPASQDLYDYKPLLNQLEGKPLPDSVRGDQRLTGMSSHQAILPLAGSAFKFAQYGKSGAWLSELLPNIGKMSDEICFIKTMWTDAINHDPAITFMQTGAQIAGRPSMGSWVTYGLGSDTDDLPAFVVLVTVGGGGDQPLYARLWGNGFLDSRFQGIQFRSGKEPVLYLTNPDGLSARGRQDELAAINQLNQLQFHSQMDPEIVSRIAQYEMAYRMQTSVPDVTDLSKEPESVFELYGADSRKPGTFAANCLLTRRLCEKGVRFIQLYHQGWDHHSDLPAGMRRQCAQTDKPIAGLLTDLKQRGLLDDTLVIWGGEFGRTSYCQGELTRTNYGRDHHPRCFTMWLAGAGVNAGTTYGQTDPYGYNIVDAHGAVMNPTKDDFFPGAVHVHDLQATIMHLLGIDHKRLTYRFQGRDFRLTDVYGHVVPNLMA